MRVAQRRHDRRKMVGDYVIGRLPRSALMMSQGSVADKNVGYLHDATTAQANIFQIVGIDELRYKVDLDRRADPHIVAAILQFPAFQSIFIARAISRYSAALIKIFSF